MTKPRLKKAAYARGVAGADGVVGPAEGAERPVERRLVLAEAARRAGRRRVAVEAVGLGGARAAAEAALNGEAVAAGVDGVRGPDEHRVITVGEGDDCCLHATRRYSPSAAARQARPRRPPRGLRGPVGRLETLVTTA